MAASCGSSTRCNMLGFGGPNSIFRRVPLAADGADVRAIAVAQHLNTMVAAIGYNKVDFAVKRGSTMAVKLSFAAALAADGANVRAVALERSGRVCGFKCNSKNISTCGGEAAPKTVFQ